MYIHTQRTFISFYLIACLNYCNSIDILSTLAEDLSTDSEYEEETLSLNCISSPYFSNSGIELFCTHQL